jgi:RND family efflux transporter MFP subunit
MNIQTPADRKIAEALKSLSIQPIETDSASKPRRFPTLGASMVALGLCAAGATAIWLRPDIVDILFRTPGQDTVAAEAGVEMAAPNQADPQPIAPDPILATPTAVLQREITGSGYVVAPQFTDVFAKSAGDVVAVRVRLGDQVSAGQEIVLLDDPSARFALQRAELALRSAELRLAVAQIAARDAETDHARKKSLFDRDALAAVELDASVAALDQATNAVGQAEVELTTAELDLAEARNAVERLKIRAPITGTVSALQVRLGDSILSRLDSARGDGELMTITDTDHLVIEADVAETNISRLSPGQMGEAILDGYPDAPFTVQIDSIAPTLSAEKGTVTLRMMLVAPPEGIRPNMAASIRLPTEDQTRQTSVQGTSP